MKVFEAVDTTVNVEGRCVLISTIRCEPLWREGFLNAFSTRRGGVSPLPKDDLHLTFRDDSVENVRENRRRFLTALDANERPLVTVHQTHSSRFEWIDDPSSTGDGHDAAHAEPEADALLSSDPRALLAVKVADCVPVLLANQKTKAVAAVHAGWRGTLKGITKESARALFEGGEGPDIVAALGPAACERCYEVGDDVAQAFQSTFSKSARFLRPHNQKWFLDVREANVSQLEQLGVPKNQIHVAPFCTMHQNELFFSHRRESSSGRAVGRLLGVIGRRS